ncbi:MAG: hypothetical protein ACP5JH_06540 [Bacteroidota bacterium]
MQAGALPGIPGGAVQQLQGFQVKMFYLGITFNIVLAIFNLVPAPT